MFLYPKKDTLNRLQFDQIRIWLEELCSHSRSKKIALELRPVSNKNKVRELLAQTQERYHIQVNGYFFPIIRCPEMDVVYERLAITGNVLDEELFVRIRDLILTANKVIEFLHTKRSSYPSLAAVTDELEKNTEIPEWIDQIIDEKGVVRSDASKELESIRRRLGQKRNETRRIFDHQLKKYKKEGWLADFFEGISNERRVLAVLSEYKRKVPGIIHFSSDTGKTTYIEPGANIEVNNEIASLVEEEKREIYKLLKQLTAQIAPYIGELKRQEKALVTLDFIKAKAELAVQLKCNLPEIVDQRLIELRRAFHPVLWAQNEKEKVKTEPLEMILHTQQRILVISGPNAGGKSIALKTLGLLQLMLQSGLMIPVSADSRMCLFHQLFIDIGDDQSIENHLSTYSSRLIKMKYFLERLKNNSLFLIDEFGTGSDPELGGAVAEAVLEKINLSGAFGVITTHYGNIKLLADRTKGIVNGSMLFEQRNLQPLFRLQIGSPGSSYTFEVAKRIGLDPEVINSAKKKLDGKKVQMDKLIVKLQRNQKKLHEDQTKLEEEKKEARRVRKVFDLLIRDLRDSIKKENEKLNETHHLAQIGLKYQKWLERWKIQKNRDSVIKSISDSFDNELAKIYEKEHQKRALKKQKKARTLKSKPVDEQFVPSKNLKIGDKVRMKGSKEKGVIEEIKGEKAVVAFDVMKVTVDVNKLKVLG